MSDWYIEVNGQPVLEPDIIKVCRWREGNSTRVAFETIGPADVSTVFLGLDHSYMSNRPLLYETMIFWHGHPLDQECERYSTREEAEQGHKEFVALVRAHQP